ALCHLCRGRRAGRPRGGAARAPAAAMSQSDRLLLEDLPSGCAPRCTRSCSARSLTILQRRSARAGHPGFRGQPAAVLEGRPAAPARRLPVPVGGPAARLRRAAGPRLAGPARAEVGRPRRGGAAGDAGHAGPSERGRAPRPRSASARGCWRQRGRTWLLIGPLVGRLQFLRDAAQRARQAAATAAPGDAAGAAARALGQPPPVVSLRVRRLETCWTEIVSKPDRVQVILSIHLDDEVDVALARAFCQESSRRPTGTRRSGPCRAPSTSPRTSTRPSTCESWGRSGCRTSASSPSPCPTKSWSPRRRRQAPFPGPSGDDLPQLLQFPPEAREELPPLEAEERSGWTAGSSSSTRHAGHRARGEGSAHGLRPGVPAAASRRGRAALRPRRRGGAGPLRAAARRQGSTRVRRSTRRLAQTRRSGHACGELTRRRPHTKRPAFSSTRRSGKRILWDVGF
ncbi:unnamed protein product, partial [Prorocentrum cordatum]